jgi:predicted kinase
MTARTYEELSARGIAATKTKGDAIVDATFSAAANRESLRRRCEKACVLLQFVELQAGRTEIERRLRARNKTIAVISDARLEDLEKLQAAYEPWRSADLIKVAADAAISETAKSALLHLTERQLRR